MYDDRSQRYQYICQNIGHHDIITLIAYLVLHFFVCNDIADHHVKLCRIDSIHFAVLGHSFHSTDIQIGSHGMFCPEHEG